MEPPAPVSLILRILRAGLQEQPRCRPNPQYAVLVQQQEMVAAWRRQIIEWVIDVAHEFRLGLDTLAVAVNFFDRLLSSVVVPAAQLQTAALACLFISSKIFERRPLCMRQITKYFSEICSLDEIRMAELNILFYLKWDTNVFTAVDFIRTTLQLVPDAEIKTEIQRRAEAIHQQALLEYKLLAYSPCAIGFACIDLACAARGFDVSPLREGLVQSGVHVEVVPAIAVALREMCNGGGQAQQQQQQHLPPSSQRACLASPGASTVTLRAGSASSGLDDAQRASAATPSSQSVVSTAWAAAGPAASFSARATGASASSALRLSSVPEGGDLQCNGAEAAGAAPGAACVDVRRCAAVYDDGADDELLMAEETSSSSSCSASSSGGLRELNRSDLSVAPAAAAACVAAPAPSSAFAAHSHAASTLLQRPGGASGGCGMQCDDVEIAEETAGGDSMASSSSSSSSARSAACCSSASVGGATRFPIGSGGGAPRRPQPRAPLASVLYEDDSGESLDRAACASVVMAELPAGDDIEGWVARIVSPCCSTSASLQRDRCDTSMSASTRSRAPSRLAAAVDISALPDRAASAIAAFGTAGGR